VPQAGEFLSQQLYGVDLDLNHSTFRRCGNASDTGCIDGNCTDAEQLRVALYSENRLRASRVETEVKDMTVTDDATGPQALIAR
jgi:hypothetical protein